LTLYEAKAGEGKLRVLAVASITVASCKSGGGGCYGGSACYGGGRGGCLVVKEVKVKGVFGNEFKSE
ncbi:hypothetical protein Tco_1257440, partial [Tanacetum coccineum]